MDQQFEGDNYHELRDAQEDNLGAALFVVMHKSAEAYFNAAKIVGRENDPIAEKLKDEDYTLLSELREPVERLAGYFRYKHGYTQPPLPGTTGSPKDIEGDWIRWLMYEVDEWGTEQPLLVREVCRVVTCSDELKRKGFSEKMKRLISKRYPLPA